MTLMLMLGRALKKYLDNKLLWKGNIVTLMLMLGRALKSIFITNCYGKDIL